MKHYIRAVWINGFWFVAVLGVGTVMASPQLLSLDEYLLQVQRGNQSVRASVEIGAGAEMRSSEAALMFQPTLNAGAQWYDDAKPSATSAFTGDKMTIDSLSLGVSEMTSFGLSGKFSYSFNYTQLRNPNPMFVSQPQYYEMSPKLEVNFPLWRNFFGREMRAAQELQQAQALATSYVEKFKNKLAMAEAEGTYWRLALAREGVKVTRESVERATKIRDWNAGRVKIQLADKADLLQAQALLEARNFELQMALDELQAASRAFNTMRGAEASDVSEQVQTLDHVAIQSLSIPQKPEVREDLKAAEQQERLLAANAQMNQEKNKPNLNLFGSLAMNGRDVGVGSSVSESFGTHHPTYAAGISLTMPFDVGTLSQVRDGYAREAEGARLAYSRKLFEQDRDWADLTAKLADAKKRFDLSISIEGAQKLKLDHEKDRLTRGRTVTFQVLMFEQDYASAQLNRIRAQADILRTVAMMKTYGSSK
ncbi:TolC family protein [Bdellovibrionota bacterium FG-2]